jgi:hypothetical protein
LRIGGLETEKIGGRGGREGEAGRKRDVDTGRKGEEATGDCVLEIEE